MLGHDSVPHAGNEAQVLLVEDMPSLALVYQSALAMADIKVAHVATGKAALAVIEKRCPRVILLDLQLPDMNGLDLLALVQERKLPASVVIITANASMRVAIDAMRAGARDYIVKPVQPDRLVVTTRNMLETSELREIVKTYRNEVDRRGFMGFIGSSLPMQAVYRIIESAAASKATVFITGESGTGKEVCAEAVHRVSPRRDKPFIALNCSAIPKDLIESELFGHVKGAFTGAIAERVGATQQAHGGTLFLDEIGEMDINLQAKLLRFLQTGAVQRVGGAKPEEVDVRIICATNRDPREEVAAGRFREDLYYRLHVIPIDLPPLRERGEDTLIIARHFLDLYAREEKKAFGDFDAAAERMIRDHDWPGNVRQLQNVIRSAVVLQDGDVLTGELLQPALGAVDGPAETLHPAVGTKAMPTSAAEATRRIQPLSTVERNAIEEAIALCGGNVPRAAAFLEVSPSTLYRKRQSWAHEAS